MFTMVAFSEAFYWIAAFAVVAALVNSAGIVAIVRHRERAERSLPYLMCFAAGILITTPLVHALPKAVANNADAGITALGGFLFMFLSNRVIKHYTSEETLAFGVTAAEGIGIHSLVDGVVYTVTFNVSLLTGVLAGTGLVVHEFAEGAITYLVLLKGEVSDRTAATYAFFIAALTTPIGAFVAYPLVSGLGSDELGLLLGFVSGVLIYVSAAHLLPEAQTYETEHSMVALLAGVGLALFVVFARAA
ncbi:putative divalent heavy-metal cations transporter [Halapricum desulfuricans]|uniref:Putative divalent heavy-metal cations transporter n=2 Tax=Halapricum desulfuricans TaxID=2841257 RepID=A0A897NFA4_9EURY|nr:putative divalent heavy-metal cations transporter [Halapricum desulfuricans]